MMKSNILQIAAVKSALLVAVFILSTSVSMATVVYTYTGNNYSGVVGNIYDTNMRIELTFTTDSLITNYAGNATALVTSFTFFDGVTLLTDTNSSGGFNLNTDSSGNVLQWKIGGTALSNMTEIGDRTIELSTRYIAGIEEYDFALTTECIAKPLGSCILDEFYGNIFDTRGTWSVSAVPIPPAIWLFGSGLLGLIGIARRKKSS